MLGLVKPRHFIPIHGEYRMLVQHAMLAEGAGVNTDGIFVLENGNVVEFDGQRASLGESVTAGGVLVDGLSAVDGVNGVVLRDRRMLASDGVVLVAVTLDRATGQPVSGPDLIARGFVNDAQEAVMDGARSHLAGALNQASDDHSAESNYVKAKIRDTLAGYFYERTRRRPMILPVVMEV